MSMFGDSGYSTDKEFIYEMIKRFLESHPISELFEILAEYANNEMNDDNH